MIHYHFIKYSEEFYGIRNMLIIIRSYYDNKGNYKMYVFSMQNVSLQKVAFIMRKGTIKHREYTTDFYYDI